MSTSYLTQHGYEKLLEELEHLRSVRREEVAARLAEAMEDGDSGIDNDAEVDAAKNEQAFVEGRIRELEMLLANVKVIEEGKTKDTVQIGSKVTIQEDGTDPEAYTIVGAAETDPSNGRISNVSPLGRALIDHKAGEEVEVKAPNGAFKVKIIKVE
ncbi:MAG: transcription elongation factor GreA [candidate division Zixibacteria bacterium]|nr:transcription elongation factor GreA [candidate division Zixibacteria bacterium]NIW46682.1 transcription elongation factor GreA [Gammaproteobacteria bacterium]NIS47309.1 transcription elongation factor GreA [candidate division Zixibacteria bacterium]NIT52194.1 transcription elongation factor GreA [candidate division Zixibacteria bacterium]NIU15421.1 transcription elongation factor GreA [candidate division Zixibacteria bacterium]